MEISELTEALRLLWSMEQNHKQLQASRLELLKLLKAIKIQKIEMEKNVLQKQIHKLDSYK